MRKFKLFAIFITIVVFVIPLFWLKQNEMDLGGDSSRLFFYDPISFLFNGVLFSTSASGFGGEIVSYFNIPFVLLLFIFKAILNSPTLLINFFNGICLSTAFISCYLIVKELLKEEKLKVEIIELSGILAALFYIFSPDSIQGWDKVMPIHNQFFLNPLMFFLLLRYFKTDKIKYIAFVLLITFIFAPNFSIIAAPPVFAFYPLMIIFLLFYKSKILKQPIIWSHLIISMGVFICIHSFHLIPGLRNTFSSGSPLYSSIFKENKIERFSYFSDIAKSVRVSTTFMGLPQLIKNSFLSKIYIILPFSIVLGFLFNKRKTYLLTGLFFLVVLFFASANITNIGLSAYKQLFVIPGFAMFKNFYGQFAYLLLFVYTILLGQAWSIILTKFRIKKAIFISCLLGLFLITMSLSFINGSLFRRFHYQAPNISIITKIDPQFEDALKLIKEIPIDAKFMTFPMTDFGYQTLFGKEGGAYQGPSIIAYLGGKKDFAGSDVFGPFKEQVFNYTKNKDYASLKDIFSLFSIKYIYYNSDPRIYEKNFPMYPHVYVRNFLPDQNSYKRLIVGLDAFKKYQVSDKYSIYEVKNENYLPLFYIPKRIVFFNQNKGELADVFSFFKNDKRLAIYTQDYSQINKYDDILLQAEKNSPFLEFFKTGGVSEFGVPYVSREPSSVLYPFAILRENSGMNPKNINDRYIDKAIFLTDKRIEELGKWSEDMKLIGGISNIENLDKSWKQPGVFEFKRFKEYNFWEISFVRYERQMLDLINKTKNSNNSIYSNTVNVSSLKKVLLSQKARLETIILNDKTRILNEKIYLANLETNMFDYLNSFLDIPAPDVKKIPYNINGIPSPGHYQPYLEKKIIKDFDFSKVKLNINGKTIGVSKEQENYKWVKFDDVDLSLKSNAPLELQIEEYPNLVDNDPKIEFDTSAQKQTDIEFKDSPLIDSTGFIKKISKWDSSFQYLISFDYLAYGNSFKIKFLEKGDKNVNQIFDEDLDGKDWKRYAKIIDSGDSVNSAFLKITNEDNIFNILKNESLPSKISIKNLSVIQIPHPKIFFKKSGLNDKENNLPKITFTKINPSKYKIKVENVISNYNLVFLNEFNKSWKIYLNDKNYEGGNIFTKIFKSISVSLSSHFIKINDSSNVAASYFNGYIKEGSSKNIFLDSSTFETLDKKEMPENSHMIVNYYANAWLITRDETRGKTNYELIVESETQKQFYIFAFLSTLSVLGVFLYSIFKILKK